MIDNQIEMIEINIGFMLLSVSTLLGNLMAKLNFLLVWKADNGL